MGIIKLYLSSQTSKFVVPATDYHLPLSLGVFFIPHYRVYGSGTVFQTLGPVPNVGSWAMLIVFFWKGNECLQFCLSSDLMKGVQCAGVYLWWPCMDHLGRGTVTLVVGAHCDLKNTLLLPQGISNFCSAKSSLSWRFSSPKWGGWDFLIIY